MIIHSVLPLEPAVSGLLIHLLFQRHDRGNAGRIHHLRHSPRQPGAGGMDVRRIGFLLLHVHSHLRSGGSF